MIRAPGPPLGESPRWRRRAQLVAALAGLLQVGSWAAVGRTALEPEVAHDLLGPLAVVRQNRCGSNPGPAARLFVWNEDDRPVPASMLHVFGRTAVEERVPMAVLDATSPKDLQQFLAADDTFGVSYSVGWNTPVYGEAGATYWRCGSCDVAYRFRYLWMFGVWVRWSGDVIGYC